MKYRQYFQFPIWKIEAIADDKYLLYLWFCNEEKFVEKLFWNEFINKSNNILDNTKNQLKEYFEGKRKVFNIPLKYDWTEFQKKVWRELQKIPYWETWSYQDIAKNINSPYAVRAVGWANHINRISIIIPCHRVIWKNWKIVWYGGGIDKKIYLLELEKENK